MSPERDYADYPGQPVSLSQLTTLRLGGPARAFVRVTTADELVETLGRLDRAGEPVLLVGGGSNLVVSDAGFAGTVVQIANDEVRYDVGPDDCPRVVADAGAGWDAVVADTVERNLGGLECLSGIPGAVGSTPVQNVGAYGVEIADVLDGVEVLDRTDGALRWITPSELALAYRTSALKHHDDRVVVRVAMRLTDDGLSAPIRYRELAHTLGVEQGERVPVAVVREQVLALRSGKGMVLDAGDHDTWSAGSFFTNPIVSDDDLPHILDAISARVGDVPVPRFAAEGGVKLSAGWLIERAGFSRGYPDDTVSVRLSTKHTLALTNRGGATTEELLTLARQVRDGVEAAFGVRLEPEPVLVGCRL
ncbi:UDP-N-acetylmuramate dehydrogenase [Williamsia maris]|uniref:UDP-N-acetylenolpyruvoylglucosamine reductase n=1 Tax=Williamsia maris TaxID=72806 RepID=A0ABT1HC72_9NOCA|nr:UDP-N-acetylmuramate dehydrogenase [Williamsia maris]MCP2175256.1 UDP-N-acetylmuramate dehydrogenase [Williamsia maris]